MKKTISILLFSILTLCCSAQQRNAKKPKAVDLGLSVKWASFNIGATVPEENGYYYAWGELKTKEEYTEKGYKFYVPERIRPAKRWNDADGFEHYEPQQVTPSRIKSIGGNIAGTNYDVARVKLGANWRMPTCEEVRELIDECTWERTKKNGVEGIKITSRLNNNWIFIPFTSYRSGKQKADTYSFCLWTGDLYDSYYDDDCTEAYSMSNNGLYRVKRYVGCCVRAVYETPPPAETPAPEETDIKKNDDNISNTVPTEERISEETCVDVFDVSY